MTQDNQSSMKQAGSPLQDVTDSVVQQLRELGLPLTRENYLLFNYGENPPELTHEQEAELPEALRKK